jgi:hypothetical protein
MRTVSDLIKVRLRALGKEQGSHRSYGMATAKNESHGDMFIEKIDNSA